jgi:predicted Zn-dependent peptidase
VGSFGPSELHRFFRSTFNPANLVVAAAGRVEHAATRTLVERHFGGLDRGRPGTPARRPKVTRAVVARSKKQLEQVHLCLGTPACRQSDPARFAIYVMNTVLGGSMSSRLFQNIREKRGLVYSISSGVSAYADTGVFTIYAATSLDSVREVLRLTVDEVRRMVDDRLPDDELRRAKEHIKGSLLLSLEGTVSRMSHLVRQELYLGRQVTLDEIAEGIEAVTADDVQKVARRYLSGQLAASVLGSLKGYRPRAKELVV